MKKKKKKLKKKVKKIFVFSFLFIIALLIFQNIMKNEVKLDETVKVDKQEEIPVTGDPLIDQLYQLSATNKKIRTIIDNKETYPLILLEMLSRNIDLTDYVLEYDNNKGKIFSNTIGKVKEGEYPKLFQYDRRWGYGMYGDNVMAINGCGPTVVSMILAGLTGRNDVTPYTVAVFSDQNGYYQNGTKWELFTSGVKGFGIIGKNLSLSKGKMLQELDKGHPIICSMKPGDFTTTGHLIAIVGVKNNQFIIHDPNSKERSNRLWSYEQIEPQIKNLWYFEKI